jgi:hypothetical protein
MEDIKLKGNWCMKLYGAHDELKQEISGQNTIQSGGKSFIASFLNSAATAAATFTMRYIAVGDGVGAENAADTALGNELGRHTGVVTVAAGAIYRVIATFASGVGTGAITEYGVFSGGTAACGTMLNRDLESVINKGANDVLEVTMDLTIG